MRIDGNKLQNEIACRQMTISDFAKQAGLPTATIYRAINGSRSSTRTAGRIAAALSVTAEKISSSYSQMDNLTRKAECLC